MSTTSDPKIQCIESSVWTNALVRLEITEQSDSDAVPRHDRVSQPLFSTWLHLYSHIVRRSVMLHIVLVLVRLRV